MGARKEQIDMLVSEAVEECFSILQQFDRNKASLDQRCGYSSLVRSLKEGSRGYEDIEIPLIQRMREAYRRKDIDALLKIPFFSGETPGVDAEFNSICYILLPTYDGLTKEEGWVTPMGNESTGEHTTMLPYQVETSEELGARSSLFAYLKARAEEFRNIRDPLVHEMMSSERYRKAIAYEKTLPEWKQDGTNWSSLRRLRTAYAEEELKRSEQMVRMCDLGEEIYLLRHGFIEGMISRYLV